MSSWQRTATLLAKGYFPKELPPAFTTSDFGNEAKEIIAEWIASGIVTRKNPAKFQGKKKRGSYLYKIETSEPETISAPKRGFERRNLHITHPIPQAFLTYEISENWHSVQKWLTRQQFTLDCIAVSKNAFRGILDINFDAHRAKKSFIEASANWIVKTDITRFYPSMYTHSIPWAAYGKENVKDNIKLYEGSFADRIDQLLRACNRNQTVGIPVGPETSRVIAEIVSSRIDDDFKRLGQNLDARDIDRLQDDWLVGCVSLEQAELTLSRIIRCYRSFGLDINGSKTSVERTTLVFEQEWISELGGFLSHGSQVLRGKRLAEFLSLGLRMQVKYPSAPVVNYLISVIENIKTYKGDAQTLESFLLRSITLSPISMSGIARVLINLHHDTKSVSVARVSKRVKQELIRNFDKGNTLECIWLLYILRGLSAKINISTIECYVFEPSSSAISLILLDMNDKGLIIGPMPSAHWASVMTEERSKSSGLWLLAYEGIRHGWLPDPNNLANKGVFKPMLDRNVVFYDPRRNVPTTKSTVKRRNRARARSRRATFSLIQSLRGFDFDDY